METIVLVSDAAHAGTKSLYKALPVCFVEWFNSLGTSTSKQFQIHDGI